MDVATAITIIVTAILTACATKWHIENSNIPAIAAAVSAVITTIGGAIWGRVKTVKIVRAETIAPGITDVPKGSETIAHISVNDPKTPDPAAVISNVVKETP